MVKKELAVEGMHCRSCNMLVDDDVSAIAGVQSVKADFASGKVSLEFDGSAETLEKARSAIRKLGYKLK